MAFFDQLKPAHSNTPKIHIILALSVYHHSQFVRDAALEKNIELYYFPPYSPHLKAIERLRMVMKRAIRNNIFFSLSPIFRDAINGLFDITLPKIAQSLRWRINENSQMIKQVPSS